jgi:hypothetical protein
MRGPIDLDGETFDLMILKSDESHSDPPGAMLMSLVDSRLPVAKVLST